MFTGIVREVGRVVRVEGGEDGTTLHVEAPQTADGLTVGDSVSVAGVCLTAEAVEASAIRFHAVPETLGRTTLARLGPGDTVNVEPALRAYSLEDREEKTIAEDIRGYVLSSDGSKVLVRQGNAFKLYSADPKKKEEPKTVSTVGLMVDREWSTAAERGGMLDHFQPGTERGGHAVCLVGYTADGRFIVRNSWGTGWGDQGFAYASPEYLQAAFFPEAYVVTVR